MSEVASLPANENLLNSVLSELKCRIKTPPPPIPCKNNKVVDPSPKKLPPTPPPKASKPVFKPSLENWQKKEVISEEEKDVNGIAEYAAYCRNVGFSAEDKPHECQTLPFLNKASSADDVLSCSKPATPPTPPSKPVRRHKHVTRDEKAKPVFQRPGLNNAHFSSQLHELFDSAFSSANTRKDPAPTVEIRHRSKTVPHFRNRNFFISKDDFSADVALKEDAEFKRSLESLDSGHGGSAKSAKPVEDIDDCFDIEGIYMLIEQKDGEVSQVEDRCNSDEGHHSNASGENEKNDENGCCVDNISISSNESADELAGTKVIVKRIKARERARQLKKHASNQKERVGALLDAAASKFNASDRIKKFRRPSLKFSNGKSKALQNLTSK